MDQETITPTFLDDLPKGTKTIIKDMFINSCSLQGFRNGGGLRVIRIEDDMGTLQGYGEHPDVLEAIRHATEAYTAGRTYAEQYGQDGLYPLYLTGSSKATCPLDAWLLQGHSFKVQRVDGYVQVSFTYSSWAF